MPSSFAISDRCITCTSQSCVPTCPTSAISMYVTPEGGVRAAINNTCIAAGRCAAVCPVNAPVPIESPQWKNNMEARRAKEYNDALVAANNVAAPSPANFCQTEFALAWLVNKSSPCEGILSLELRTEEELVKLPGSRALISVPTVPPDPLIRARRFGKSYSFLETDSTRHRFLISTQGLFSDHLSKLRIGQRLLLGTPMGGYDLDTHTDRGPCIFLVAGTGVAPAIALARSAAHQGRPVIVMESARSPERLWIPRELGQEILDGAISYQGWATRAPGGSPRKERATAAQTLFSTWAGCAHWWAFGARGFVHSVLRLAESNGVGIGDHAVPGQITAEYV